MYLCVLSHVRLFMTLWAVAYQATLSTGFSRQKYWTGLPFPSPGDLPDPGTEPLSSGLAGGFFTTKPLEKVIAPHSSTLAWKIPWMEEPGGLQSMGSRRVGHD